MYDYTYYDYGYDYGTTTSMFAGFAIFGVIIWLIGIAASVLTIISMWKIFTKAGKPGWAAIIPVYNIIVMLEISELPMWYIALYFVPGANIYAMIKINIEIAHKFGKSTGFGVGMALLQPVFMTMLAFSNNSTFNGVQSSNQPTYQQPVQQTQQVQSDNLVQPSVSEVTQVIPNVQMVQPIPDISQESVLPVEPQSQVEEPSQQQVPLEVNQTVAPSSSINCGSNLMPNAKFCTNCGKQI